jgi:two-component system, NtrC family, sensor kinase
MLTDRADGHLLPARAEHPDAGNAQSVASGVRLRVLLPLAATMSLLLAVFLGIFIYETNNRRAEDVARTAKAIDVMFREQSAEGVAVMRSIMELVLQDRHLEAALRAGDRQALLELSAPILKEIRARNNITHFYYIQPDRRMLLRVQAPDKHGDVIDRFVLMEAQRTGKPFWGNEQGPLGSFTLRVAYPWFSGGELIGYLEMGIEFEDIMATIKKYLDVNVFVAIDKSFFDRAKWEEAQKKRPLPVPWNEFPSVVVLSRTTPDIPAPIADYLRDLKGLHSKRTFEIAWDGRIAQTIVVPFSNLRQQELGELVVVNDVTAIARERRQAVLWVAVLGTVIAGALMLFFYVLLGRVQRDVAKRTADLAATQRVLMIEQMERQRTERELQLQQERNELLEARARMVDELAAAKDAAETALRHQKRAEAERRVLEHQLHHAQKIEALGQLAGGIAHDLNNALVPILAISGVVQRDLPPDSSHRQRLDVVIGSARRARELVGQVLAFSRREQAARREFDLAEMAAAALVMLRASIPATIALVDRIEPALPILGDPGQMHQVLMNLVMNAAQAIGNGQGTVVVEACRETDGAHIRLSVSDTGCGMDEATRERIFEPFFTTKEVGSGTGLGLSIAHGVVTNHGGTIAVESTPGQGTRFDVVLPVVPVKPEAGDPGQFCPQLGAVAL